MKVEYITLSTKGQIIIPAKIRSAPGCPSSATARHSSRVRLPPSLLSCDSVEYPDA